MTENNPSELDDRFWEKPTGADDDEPGLDEGALIGLLILSFWSMK
jgi:hypothetical protein